MPLVLTDQLEDLSKAMVQAVCAVAGVTCTDAGKDRNSRDVLLQSVDEGIISAPSIFAQLKATTQVELAPNALDFPFDLPIKNYNDLRARSNVPSILIVALIPRAVGAWITMTHDELVLRRCLYWLSLAGEPATTNTATVRVRVSTTQLFTPMALADMMERLCSGGTL